METFVKVFKNRKLQSGGSDGGFRGAVFTEMHLACLSMMCGREKETKRGGY